MSKAAGGSGLGVRAILSSQEYNSRDVLFRRKDAEAGEEQAGFLRLLSSINLLVLAVAVLSGVILALPSLRDLPWVQAAVSGREWLPSAGSVGDALAFLVAGLALAATTLGQFAREGDRLGRWQRLRAEAEKARAERFRVVALAAASRGPEAARAALDHVLGGLVEDQRQWYAERAARHRASARVTRVFNVLATLLGVLASAAAITAALGPANVGLLLAGVLAASIAAFASDRENLYRDRINAELYEMTAEKLSALAAGADQVTASIDAGNPGAVVAFTDLVAEELQAEHARWTAGLDVAGGLLNRLDQRLRQARTGQAAPPEPQPASERSQGAQAASAVGELLGADAGLQAARKEAAAVGASVPQLRSVGAVSESLGRWTPVLKAASMALPPPHGDQARTLLDEVATVAAPLAGNAGASGAIDAASALVERLRAGNPLGDWIGGSAPKLAGALGTILPPAAMILGVAGVAAKLGEAAYLRWATRILGTPISTRLLKLDAANDVVVRAALRQADGFAAAYRSELERGNQGALTEAAELALSSPDALWERDAARWGGDRARFDAAVTQFARALLAATSDADLDALGGASLPGGASPAALLQGAERLRDDPATAEVLHVAVTLSQELRSAGVGDPVAALQAATEGKGDP